MVIRLQVAHLIRVLFGKLKFGFLPYFDTILHAFVAMLVGIHMPYRHVHLVLSLSAL